MNILNHLAIIMDGNGRWAKAQGKPRSFGHEKGAKVLLDSAVWGKKLGIKTITYYVFSTENWKRSEKEINFLFKLPIKFFDKYFQEFINEGIKVNIIGDRKPLPDKLNKKLDEVIELTKNNDKITVNLALNYGGQDEIVNATKVIAAKVQAGELNVEDINKDNFAQGLYFNEKIDLVIRTSGEFRLSNFLLWQIAYAEVSILDCNWPDFSEQDLVDAYNWYTKRERRFGGVISE